MTKTATEHVRSTLERLEAHWRNQGAPIASHLSPGVSDVEIDRLQELAGVVLPDVARELYRWHNGATAGGADPNSEDSFFGACSWQFLSLAQITDWVLSEWRVDNRRWAERFPEFEPEGPWPRQWFPVFKGNAEAIVINCHGGPDLNPARVAWASYRESTPATALTHYSLVSLLQTWLLWFDVGAVGWDSVAGHWLLDEDRYAIATYRSGFW